MTTAQLGDPFSDFNLMNENIGKIERGDVLALRVSAEHYLWLCSARSTIAAITHTAGGQVEGHPTSTINVLQRIRQLVEIEKASGNEDPSGQRREATEVGWMGDIGGNPFGPSDR